MNRIKKIIVSLLFVSIMIVIGLTGLAAEKVVIEVSQGNWEKPALDSLIPKFEAENPDIKIQPAYFAWNGALEMMTTRLEGGKGPDVLGIMVYWIPPFVKKGWLLDLTKAGYTSQVDIDDYYKSQIDAVTLEGGLYGLPYRNIQGALIYNTEMYEEAGYKEPPKTWDEFLDCMKKITIPDQRWGYGMQAMHAPMWALEFLPFLYTAGGRIISEDKKSAAVNSPEGVATLEWVTDLYKKWHVVPPTLLNDELETLYGYWTAKRISTFWHTSHSVSRVLKEYPEFPVGTMPWPAQKAGDPYPGVSYSDFSVYSINAATKHQAEAWKVVEFLQRPENQAILTVELPARKSALKEAPFPGNLPFDDPHLQGLQLAATNSITPWEEPYDKWTEIQTEVLLPMGQKALLGQGTAQEVADWAANEINKILQR